MMSILALTSCKVDLKGWDTNLIEESGKVITKEYKLKPFEEVHMRCVGDYSGREEKRYCRADST